MFFSCAAFARQSLATILLLPEVARLNWDSLATEANKYIVAIQGDW